MPRKGGKNKTPRRKSERKKKRTAKGEYYDQHFEEYMSMEVESSPAPAQLTVSVALEQGENSSPVPELTTCAETAVEKDDIPNDSIVAHGVDVKNGESCLPPDHGSVSVTVEQGEILPPVPEHIHVSVAVEQGKILPPVPEHVHVVGAVDGKTPPHCVSLKEKALAQRGFDSFSDWDLDPDHIYIGRSMTHYIQDAVASKWQNPFPSDIHGRERSLVLFEEHLRNNGELLDAIGELEGKEIGYWCKPLPCHGDVLIRVFNEKYVDGAVDPSPAPALGSVSVAVEQGEILPPAPEHNVSDAVEEGEISPPVPERIHVVSAVEKDVNLDHVDIHSPIPISVSTQELASRTTTESNIATPVPIDVATQEVYPAIAITDKVESGETSSHLPSGINISFEVTNSICAEPNLQDIPTPLNITVTGTELDRMPSTPFLSRRKSTSTPSHSHIPAEGSLRKSCMTKPLNLRRELELATSFSKNSEDQPESDVVETHNIVEIHNDSKNSDTDFQTLCAFHDLYHVSPYGITYFEQIFESMCRPVNSSDLCIDLTSREQEKQSNRDLPEPGEQLELTSKIEQLEKLYLEEKRTRERITNERDLLHKQLFQKCEKLKISEDQVKQLQDSNRYRGEVLRLEKLVEEMEREMLDLAENLEKERKDMETIRGNLSNLMTENTVLKNTAKQQKREHCSTDSQTVEPTNSVDFGVQTNQTKTVSVQVQPEYGVDFGVQTGHTVSVQVECNEPTDYLNSGFGVDYGIDSSTQTADEDKKLIEELVHHLDTIEKNIEYTNSQECLKDIAELVERLDSIEKYMASLQQQQKVAPFASSPHIDINRSMSSSVHPSGTAYIPSIQDTALSQLNRFQPLQHVNNSDQANSDLFEDIPIRPGLDLYSDVVRGANKKVSIFSTSITKGVNVRKLNRDYKGERARIHRFHGKKARHIKHYVPVHMKEDRPDTCVIVAGGNDLPDETPILQIANELIEAGITCKNHGATNVIISSVLPRSNSRCQSRREELNRLLVDLCVVHNFVYMDNWNMSVQHLRSDGVHLNKFGDDVLLFNLLWYLNA